MSERRESGRLSHRAAAPKAPPKVLKYDPIEMEIRGDEAPGSFGDNHRKALAKKSKESSEPQALVFRHLEERVDPEKGFVNVPVKSYDEDKVSLARAGETVLETFYGMFYACDDATKEWKLAVDGFIPLCFIQEQGNANKPFKIIAVSGSVRLMEFSVTKDTKCAQNKAFVKWNEGNSNMFGVRFAKETQANQFYSALSRMKSTLIKTAELFKQPERKAVVSQISDPKTSGVPHSKHSLIMKLPNKETTVMSVPGLLTMSELFDLICKKEGLNPQEHQLSLPRVGKKELTYESDTVLGSLKIREVSIIYVGVASDNGEASGGASPVKVESLLEDENEKGKRLDITLPNGQQRSLLVPLTMPIRNLETYICKKENLNPRFHSLQSIDFKHQCFDPGSAVGDIEFSELRLLEKKGHSSRSRLSKNSSSDDSCVGNSSRTNLSAGLKANHFYSSQESLDLEERNTTRMDSKASSNSSSNSDEMATIGERSFSDSIKSSQNARPPVLPQPYMATKSNQKLQVNELKSSRSFSEYGEKRSNPAVREPNLKEGGKPKRKAPRPPRPPQPSPRPDKKEIEQNLPTDHPATEKTAVNVASPSSTTQGSPGVSPNQRYAKKRPAPARPPAPKPSTLRQRSGSSLSVDDTGAEGTKDHDRPPPEFYAPPPPDDEPPPLDECEHPVSPLSDDELHETTWPSGFEGHEVNGFPEEAAHSLSIKTGTTERPVAAARREKPERPPLPPARQTSLPSSPTSSNPPDHVVSSPEPIPMKFLIPTPEKRSDSAASGKQDEHDEELSRISFDGDSRSSSIDITSFPESDMPMLSPIEGYKPFPVEPPMEFAEEEVETKTESAPEEPTLPPPLRFSKSENLSISNDSGNVEYSGTDSDITIEDMVVPPPPLLTEDEIPHDDSREKPDSLSQIHEINSIPPPMDFAPPPPSEFASPPAEFADTETTSPQPQKKKLGLNSSFPWLAEPQLSFNAEITDKQVDVQEEAKPSPVSAVPEELSVNKDDQTFEKSIPDEVKKVTKEMDYASPPAFEVPAPFIPDSEETLESEPFKITSLDDTKKDLPQEVPAPEVPYKTPFDDMEDVSPTSEEPDEGFDDLPEPVLEASVNKNFESKDKVADVKGVGQYELDLSEGADLSPPTPPLTSPPGSGYVSPTLPSPLVSPREDAQPEPPTPAEFVPPKTEETREEKTKNVVSVSSSSSSPSTDPVELPNPPPITVPPLRRYSDLAADMSFASPGIKTNTDHTPPKESEKTTTSASSKGEKQPQAPSGYKRPTPSAFRTQSWADIKNRERELEEERKKKNEQANTREPPPASLVFRNLNRNSANAIRPKSWVAPSSKGFNPILPSMYKAPEITKQASSTTDAKGHASKSVDSAPTKTATEVTTKTDIVQQKPVTIVPMSTPEAKTVEQPKDKSVNIIPMSSANDTKAGTSRDKPVTIVPLSSSSETKAGASRDKPVTIVPLSSSSETKAGASRDKPVTIVPLSSSSETKAGTSRDKPVTIVPLSSSSETKAGASRDKPVTIVPLSSSSETKAGASRDKPVTIVPLSSSSETKAGTSRDKPVTIVPLSSSSETKAGASRDKPVTIVPLSSSSETKAGTSRDKPVTIVPLSSSSETKAGTSRDKPVTIVPLSSSSETKAGTSRDKPVTIVPLSSSSETKAGTSRDKPVTIVPLSSSSDTKDESSEEKDATTKVVMRKKTDKLDTTEKRKSVQDMMSMFGASKDSRRKSDDVTPQQSPAMRSLEEKVSRSSKQYGISSLVETLSAKPGQKDSTTDSKMEAKAEERSVISAKDTKTKSAERMNAQRAQKMILANDNEPASSTSGKKDTKTEEERKKDPKASESKPRSNSLNPREKYNVLFPKNEPKETSKPSIRDTKSSGTASSPSQISTINASAEAGKVQGKSAEPEVTLREKDVTKTIDPFKRRSMPVYVVENNERQQPQGGSNLKILMAHQITDVDVVPKGRVAAMKAAWKKEGK